MDIINILLGGGILAFLQFLITRWDERRGKKNQVVKALEDLSKKVDKIQYTIDEREAVLSRTHILRFNDELYNGISHSKEYFDQTLEDITTYDKFCESHPEFKNARTTLAVQNIKDTYGKLHAEHKFL